MLSTFFAADLYVKVYRNKFIIENINTVTDNAAARSFKTFIPESCFTTERLLAGNFMAAEHCLKKAVKSTLPKRLIPLSPAILIQPMEMIEGGLSEVEERLFQELAHGAGAFKVVVWLGKELSASEVAEKIKYG